MEVLAGEQTGSKRAPGRQSEPEVLVEPGVLALDLVPLQQVVLRLLHHRLVEVMALRDLERGTDVVRRPLRGSPVEGLPRRDDLGHREHGFFDRRLGIGPVAVQQVDEVEIETLQRTVDCLHEVLAVQRLLHVHVVEDSPEELRRDHIRMARPGELRNRFAEDRLGLTQGIDLGGVEEVHSVVAGEGELLFGEGRIDLGPKGHPGAEGQHADLETGITEPAVLHRSLPSVQAPRRAARELGLPATTVIPSPGRAPCRRPVKITRARGRSASQHMTRMTTE